MRAFGGGVNAEKVLRSPHVYTYPTAVAAQLGKDVLRELRDAVADDSFMGDGGLVGVPCMHLYAQVWIWERNGTVLLTDDRFVFGVLP